MSVDFTRYRELRIGEIVLSTDYYLAYGRTFMPVVGDPTINTYNAKRHINKPLREGLVPFYRLKDYTKKGNKVVC